MYYLTTVYSYFHMPKWLSEVSERRSLRRCRPVLRRQ